MWFLCLCFPFCLVSPYQCLSCYHLFLIDSHWTGPPITFLSVFLVLVFCLVMFLCVLLLWVVFCCWPCFCLESWRLLDYVQVPYQFTLVPPTNGGYLYASISQFTCSMQHAIERWTTWRKPRGVGRKKILFNTRASFNRLRTGTNNVPWHESEPLSDVLNLNGETGEVVAWQKWERNGSVGVLCGWNVSVHCAAVKERPGGARGRRMPKNTLPRHANCDVCVSVRTRRLMSFLCLKIPPGDGGWAPTSQFLNWAYQVLFDFTAPKDSQSSLVRDNSTTLTYLFFFFWPTPGISLVFLVFVW